MTSTRKLVYQLLMFLLAIGLPACVFGFGSDDSIGTVSVKTTPAWVERAGQKLNINSFGLRLKMNDTVKTGEGGQAQIELNNGNNIYVAPVTELQLTDDVVGEGQSTTSRLIKLLYGKIRAKIQKARKERFTVKTATAVIGVKGTDFITEYQEKNTRVGTVEGLVNLLSDKTQESVDIPEGAMASVSVFGELMPLEEFAGELMEGVEFAGKKMSDDDIAGEKVTY